MNSESKSKFYLWLSEHPESFHPSDGARMFDFVNTLHETEGNICIDEIFSGFYQKPSCLQQRGGDEIE